MSMSLTAEGWKVIMRQAAPGADPVESRLTGFYQISGNQLTVTAEGSSPGDAITFAAEGDRLELTLYGTTMILTRQNDSK